MGSIPHPGDSNVEVPNDRLLYHPGFVVYHTATVGVPAAGYPPRTVTPQTLEVGLGLATE